MSICRKIKGLNKPLKFKKDFILKKITLPVIQWNHMAEAQKCRTLDAQIHSSALAITKSVSPYNFLLPNHVDLRR